MNWRPFRLFVLGAGFSRPAGLPLGPELLDMVREEIRSFHQQHGGWDGPLERDIREWKELYPARELNLESVLAYSQRQHFLRLRGSKEMHASGSESVVAARPAIQRLLVEATPEVTPQTYLDFARRLTPNDTVLTFNYDTLLEQALDELRKPYSLTPEWWLPSNSREVDSKDQSVLGQYVNILKLHGSVDWYDRQFYDESRDYFRQQCAPVPDPNPLFGPSALTPIESLARGHVESFGTELLGRVWRVPNHRIHFPLRNHDELHPFILPPAHDKLLGQDPICDLWENMHRGLDYAAVVMIGYSMPFYDAYAYEAIGQLLVRHQNRGSPTSLEQARIPVQVVSLGSSESDVRTQYPFLDDSARVWARGFDDRCLEWIDWAEQPN